MLSAPAPDSTPPASDAWLTPRRFALLLAVLTFAAYPQVAAGWQTFVYRDFGYFSYPIARYIHESFWRGEIPLWNPLNNCGLPFLAQWNTQPLYPPALFYVLLPPSYAVGVFCLLHLFLGGLGMFLLARRWTQNNFAAAFAGIVFAFNGLMLNSLTLPNTIGSLGWMPWVVWLTERAWREGGRAVVVAAIAGALQMLAGGVEMILLTWVFVGALALAELARGKWPRGKIFLRAATVVLIVTGLCLAQLLPFFDLLRHSQRHDHFYSAQWPMPPDGWLNFLLPIFHCRAYQGGVFMQARQYWTASYYAGIATLALAALALWRTRNRRVWLLAGLSLFCLVLALGEATPVYRALRDHVGIVSLMRYPVKFVILPVFALPLLAAYGLAEQSRAPQPKTNWRWHATWTSLAVLTIGLVIWNQRFLRPGDDVPAISLNGIARVVLFALIAAGIFLLGKISSTRVIQLLQFLLLLVVWLDLSQQAPQPPTVNRSLYEPHPDRFAVATPKFGSGRAMIPPSASAEFLRAYLPNLADDYASRRYALFADCNLLDDVAATDGSYPLYLREMPDLLSGDPPAPLLDFLGVSQIIVIHGNQFDWEARATAAPLLTAGQKPVFADAPTTLQGIMSTNFNPREEVYLPLEAKGAVTAGAATANVFSPTRLAAHRLAARVEANTNAIMVVAQSYYHPWHAYVDGRPTPLWRANHAFQAFEVPAGAHAVELRYEDSAFRIGAVISLLTLAACVGWYVLGRKTVPTATDPTPNRGR